MLASKEEMFQAKLVTAEKEIHNTTQMLVAADNVLHDTTQTLVNAEKKIRDTAHDHAEQMELYKTTSEQEIAALRAEVVLLKQSGVDDTDENDDEWRTLMLHKQSKIWMVRHAGSSHLTCASLINRKVDRRVEYCISVKDNDSDSYLTYLQVTSRCTIGFINGILTNADYVTYFTILSIPPTGMWTSRHFRVIAAAVNSNAPGLTVDSRVTWNEGSKLPALLGKFVRREWH